MTLSNGKSYAFRVYNDKGTYATSRAATSGAVTGWNGWKALDATATAFCLSNGMPIRVFGLKNAEDIVKAVKGEIVGTIVTPD